MKTLNLLSPRIDDHFLKQYEELDEPGKPKMLHELIRLVSLTAPHRFFSLRKAIEQGVDEEVRKQAHALKNTVANVGATRLAGLCFKFEEIGTKGELENAKTILQEIQQELDLVLLELERRLYSD